MHTHTHTHTYMHTHTHTHTHTLASCLVPLADLFNMAVRERSSNVKCATNDASTHFECYTLRPVPAGAQVIVTLLHEDT